MLIALLACTLSGDSGGVDSTAAWPDNDGDGFRGTQDCDDSDPDIHPAATDACDAVDNDCDGHVDEGFDDDGDGLADCTEPCPMYVDPNGSGLGTGASDAPYDTLQDAVDNATRWCNEILVRPGTYAGRVDFGVRDLVVLSTDGAEVTTLTLPAGSNGSVVTIDGEQSSACRLEGFTLTGGNGSRISAWNDLRHGGGLYIQDSNPTIRGNRMVDNTVTGRGAGALLYRYGGVFEDNVVADNTITEQRDFGGAGVYVYRSQAIVRGNTISGNRHLGGSGDGGGVLIRESDAVLEGNRIDGNSASSAGGGVRTVDSTVWVVDNLITDNQPDGVVVSYDDAGLVAHNTLVGNPIGLHSLVYLEGSYTGLGPTVQFANNLVADADTNTLITGPTQVTWTTNLFSSGDAPDGSLVADPLLDSDRAPTTGSPAIDAATVLSDDVGSDLNGQDRPQGAAPDIGCFEVE